MNFHPLLYNPVIQQSIVLVLFFSITELVRPAKFSVKDDTVASHFWDISFMFIVAAGLFIPAYLTTQSLTVSQGDLLAGGVLALIGLVSGKARHRLFFFVVALGLITILTVWVGNPLTSITEIPFEIVTRLGFL